MSAVPKRLSTEAEYWALESRSETKHEYVNGEIIPWGDGGPQGMAGASTPHNRIATDLLGLLWTQLRGRGCELFNSDMRVRIKATGLLAYPNISALCHEPEIDPTEGDSLLNPTLIVEVLSESTERYDRRAKSAHYRRLDSLQEYVLVTQHEMRVEVFRRQSENVWVLQEFTGPGERVKLESVGCELVLGEIYQRVKFPLRPAVSPFEIRGGEGPAGDP